VISTNATRGSTRLLLSAVPLLAATFGCTATVTNPQGAGGDTAATGGSSTGGSSAQGGSAGNAGSGGSSAGGTSGSGSGGTGGTAPPLMSGEPRPVSMEGEPIYTRFVRLTNDQWENSVRDILRLSAPTGLSQSFLQAVGGTTDFDNNELVVYVDNTSWVDFQLAAEALADQVTATDAALQAVVATTDPATFIRTLGRRAFRRDLTQAEVTAYQAIHTQGSMVTTGTQSAFTKGANYVINSMLQSPHFLYRIEMGDTGAPLSGFEMAAKLSLWLRDTTPTDQMLDAANAFTTAEGAVTQAMQMLSEPSATLVMRKFFGQLYKFALYDSIVKSNVTGYSEALNPEFKESSYLFFDWLFSQDLGVAEMLTSTTGFVGQGMAPLYGVTVQGTGLRQVELPSRAGYFSQIPFLALWARNNDPDSIHRGARINLDTLCADPGFPDIELPDIPPADPGETNRDVISDLTETCGRLCHGEIINPIGFAFENFDGLGRSRDTDNGQPVNTTGTYPFAEGMLTFDGAPKLMELMAQGTQAHQCFSKKMTSFALERDVVETDRPLIVELGEVSRGASGSIKQVMLALAKHDAFRTRVGGAQ
jgi:hypothetical protein